MKFKSDVEVQAGIKDSAGSSGNAGSILSSTSTGVTWIDNYADWTSVVKHIVKNNGIAVIPKGAPVYVTGSDGTNMLVGLAGNGSEATSSKTMGLVQTQLGTTGLTQTGYVITEGLLQGLNTAGRTAGEPIWLGPNGTLIYGLTNKPYAPAHLVFIGIVTKVSAGNGEVFVKVQNGFELNEIHDVDIKTTVPVNGDVLGFDGTLWVNKTIAGWLGYTPANDAVTISTTAPLQGGGNLTANRTLSITQAGISSNGFLSSIDWNTFNNKQNQLNGTGFVRTVGTTVSYINGTSSQYVMGDGTFSSALNTRIEQTFIATAGQTTFSLTYDVGQVEVYYNGSKLFPNEFTATNGTSIVLQNPATLNAQISIVKFITPIGGGVTSFNTRTGAVTLTSTDVNTALGYTAANDANVVKLTGNQTVAGAKTFTSTLTMDGSGSGAAPIVSIFNTGINRLLSPVLRLYGSTNIGSNYVELYGSNATSNRIIQLPDRDGTVALGSGTNNYVPKFINSNTIGDSIITDTGTNVGINVVNPVTQLNVGHNGHGIGISYLAANALPSIAGLFTDSGVNGGQGFGSLQIKSRTDFAGYSINFFTAATANTPVQRMTIGTSGDIGMGTGANAGTRLYVAGTGNPLKVSSSDNGLQIGVGYQGVMSGYIGGISSALYAYSVNGGYLLLNSSSAWVAASDAKRKRNFEKYNVGLEAIKGLKPKLYNMDFQEDGDEKQVGLVAQEVKEHIPMAYEDNNGFIGLNYNAIIVTMVNAIQEQQAIIQSLTDRLSVLENK